MRVQHELEKGIICERCLEHVTKENYKRINVSKAIIEDTTGRFKVIHRVNLCQSCYNDYRKLVNDFIERGEYNSTREVLRE